MNISAFLQEATLAHGLAAEEYKKEPPGWVYRGSEVSLLAWPQEESSGGRLCVNLEASLMFAPWRTDSSAGVEPGGGDVRARVPFGGQEEWFDVDVDPEELVSQTIVSARSFRERFSVPDQAFDDALAANLVLPA